MGPPSLAKVAIGQDRHGRDAGKRPHGRLANAAMAGTAKRKALDAGANMLDAEAFAETLVCKTLTDEAGDKALPVHDDGDGNTAGKLIGGGRWETEIHATTNDGMVCLSWNKSQDDT